MSDHMTLGGLIYAMESMPVDARVALASFGGAGSPGPLVRHRVGADGLAITPVHRPANRMVTAGEFVKVLHDALGLSHGRSDSHPVWLGTPVWVSSPDDVQFHAVTEVELGKGQVVQKFALVRTTDLAPVHGPSIQRVSDEEAMERIIAWRQEQTGQRPDLDPVALKYLLRLGIRGHSSLPQALAAAEKDLADWEAKRVEMQDRVEQFQADIAQNRYILGISDDRALAKKETL